MSGKWILIWESILGLGRATAARGMARGLFPVSFRGCLRRGLRGKSRRPPAYKYTNGAQKKKPRENSDAPEGVRGSNSQQPERAEAQAARQQQAGTQTGRGSQQPPALQLRQMNVVFGNWTPEQDQG